MKIAVLRERSHWKSLGSLKKMKAGLWISEKYLRFLQFLLKPSQFQVSIKKVSKVTALFFIISCSVSGEGVDEALEEEASTIIVELSDAGSLTTWFLQTYDKQTFY